MQSHTKAHSELGNLVKDQTDMVKTNYTPEDVKPIDCVQHFPVRIFENTGSTEIGRKLVKAEVLLDLESP